MRRYHVTTFGCQMNAHDSERIKGMLESLGLGEAVSPDEADVVVFNTCTIREKPDTRLAAYLGNAAARKRERPELVIAVGGCSLCVMSTPDGDEDRTDGKPAKRGAEQQYAGHGEHSNHDIQTDVARRLGLVEHPDEYWILLDQHRTLNPEPRTLNRTCRLRALRYGVPAVALA